MKILVVEDDRAVAQALKHLLASCHYAVDIAGDGEEGLQMADDFEYALILLDVLLPSLDGIAVCQQLRKRELQTPILLLTGQDGGHQKAIALNAGADDYVVKPFDAEELIARVQALLRRGGPRTQPILTWGQLSVNPSSCRVTYGTHLISTTPKEYAILELLLRNPQKIYSAKAILDQAWSSLDSPGEESVRGHIKELRKKLKDAGAPGELIKTVYRAGYQINPAYSSTLASQEDNQLTDSQIAELRAVNEELRQTVTTIQADHAELRQQHQTLLATNQQLQQQLDHQERLHHNYAVSQPQASVAALGDFGLGLPSEIIVREPFTVSPQTLVQEALVGLHRVFLQPPSLATVGGRASDKQGPRPATIHHTIRASCAVVVENQQVLGTLTPTTLVRLMAQQQPLETLTVGQVMSPVTIVLPESELTATAIALDLLQSNRLQHLPVVDTQNHLVGIVSYESLFQRL